MFYIKHTQEPITAVLYFRLLCPFLFFSDWRIQDAESNVASGRFNGADAA